MHINQRHVERVPLPEEASIAVLYPGSNLADAYAVRLPHLAQRDPESLARFMFARQPGWVAALLGLRDLLVAGFGLKTARQLQQTGQSAPRQHVGIFRIYSRSEREIVLGEDDKHLDFRISVLCRPDDGDHDRVIVTTAVHCHNRLGRLYIWLIAPFHTLVVRSTLSRAARAGWQERQA
jgi:hypothetical protein